MSTPDQKAGASTTNAAQSPGGGLADIKAIIAKNTSGTTLTLQAGDFQKPSLDAPSIAGLLGRYFGAARLTITGCAVVLDTDQSYRLDGRLRNPFLGATPLGVSLSFTYPQESYELAIEFSDFPPGWALSKAFPAISGTVLSEFSFGVPSITVESADKGAPETKTSSPQRALDQDGVNLRLAATLSVDGLPKTLGWIFGGGKALQVSGTIIGSESAPVISLKTDLRSQFTIFGKPFPVGLTFHGAPDPKPYSASFQIVAQISCKLAGKEEKILLSATAASIWPLSLALRADLKPTLTIHISDIGVLLGIDALSALPPKLAAASLSLESMGATLLPVQMSLQSPYLTVSLTDAWQPGEHWMVFTGMRLTFLPTFSTYTTVAVAEGDGTVFGQPVTARVSFPHLEYSLRLAEGTTLDVAMLLAAHGVVIPGLKTTLCKTFELQGSIDDHSYSFLCELDDVDVAIGEQSLPLTSVRLCLSKDPGGVVAEVEAVAKVGTSATFQLSAAYEGDGGWNFVGEMREKNLDLADLADGVSALLGGLDTGFIRNCKTDASAFASIQFNTKSHAFNLLIDTKSANSYSFGNKLYDIIVSASFATSVDQSTKRRTSTASFQGTFQIGKADFLIAITAGDDPSFKAEWVGLNGQTIGLNDLAAIFGFGPVPGLPHGLDLALQAASFSYENKKFTLFAESRTYGDAFFTVGEDDNGDLSFVFGLTCTGIKKLSDIPGIGAHLTGADFIDFKSVDVLVSSGTFTNYPVPQAPSTGTINRDPGAESSRRQPSAAAGTTLDISPGVSLAMVLDFDAFVGSKRSLSHLASFMNRDELCLQVDFSSAALRIFAGLNGPVTIPAGRGKTLALESPRLELDIGDEFIVQLSGGIGITYQKTTKITATARIILDESEANVALDVTSNRSILPIPDPDKLMGFSVKDFGLAMGVFFEPPGFDFGIEGKIQIDGESSPDSFAIILEIAMAGPEPVPNLLYLSFYIDEIDLGQFLRVFTKVADAPTRFADIKATNLSVYFCEEPDVVLPDGTIAPMGLGFSADIDLFGFGFGGMFAASITEGIEASAQCEPVNLMGALKITGDGKELSREYQEVNGRWVPVNNDTVVQSKVPTRKEVIIPAGGPVFSVKTIPPHLHVDMSVTLFDIVGETITASITPKGISFELNYSVEPIETFTLRCTLQSWSSFSAGGTTSVGINAAIPIPWYGKIDLSTNVAMTLGISISSKMFRFNIDAHFEFRRRKLYVPRITLGAPPSSLAELPAIILKQIIDNAWEIFKHIFGSAETWASYASKGVFCDKPDIAKGLRTHFDVTPLEAAKIMLGIRISIHDTVQAMKDVYGLQSMSAILAAKGAGYDVAQVTEAVKRIYGLTESEIAREIESVYGPRVGMGHGSTRSSSG